MKLKLPPALAVKLANLHRPRVTLEREQLRIVRRDARELAHRLRDLVGDDGDWDVAAHGRVMRQLADACRAFGSTLSQQAFEAGVAATQLGIAVVPQTIALVSAAVGKERTVSVSTTAASAPAVHHVSMRTNEVGAPTGEALGRFVKARSLQLAQGGQHSAAEAGALLAREVRPRAVAAAERVITTEITAATSAGTSAAIGQATEVDDGALTPSPLRDKKPRKVWDATLDMRVCKVCEPMHHVVVDIDKAFPAGVQEPPAHPRCRCSVLPWFDEWTETLREEGIKPGPRTGVQEMAERRLPDWADHSPPEPGLVTFQPPSPEVLDVLRARGIDIGEGKHFGSVAMHPQVTPAQVQAMLDHLTDNDIAMLRKLKFDQLSLGIGGVDGNPLIDGMLETSAGQRTLRVNLNAQWFGMPKSIVLSRGAWSNAGGTQGEVAARAVVHETGHAVFDAMVKGTSREPVLAQLFGRHRHVGSARSHVDADEFFAEAWLRYRRGEPLHEDVLSFLRDVETALML